MHGTPNADFIVGGNGIAELATPLVQVDVLVIIFEKEVVNYSPVHPEIGPLEEADGGENLGAILRAGEGPEEADGVLAVIKGGSRLDAQAVLFKQWIAPVQGCAKAEIGVDAQVIGPLGTVQSDKSRQVVKQTDRRTPGRFGRIFLGRSNFAGAGIPLVDHRGTARCRSFRGRLHGLVTHGLNCCRGRLLLGLVRRVSRSVRGLGKAGRTQRGPIQSAICLGIGARTWEESRQTIKTAVNSRMDRQALIKQRRESNPLPAW